MTFTCEFEFPSDMESLEKIAQQVVQAAEAAGLTDEEIYHVQMAVDEACTNIIQHAYQGDEGPIHLSCRTDDKCFTITITDRGKPFDPEAVPAPNITSPLKDRKVGGLGMFFMRKFMDEIHFEFSTPDGNRLTMVKRIHAHSKPPSGTGPQRDQE